MQIISELEQVPRGAYTGAFGWLNRDGDLDLNILIRTAEVDGHQVSFRTGAGIVVDSTRQGTGRDPRQARGRCALASKGRRPVVPAAGRQPSFTHDPRACRPAAGTTAPAGASVWWVPAVGRHGCVAPVMTPIHRHGIPHDGIEFRGSPWREPSAGVCSW